MSMVNSFQGEDEEPRPRSASAAASGPSPSTCPTMSPWLSLLSCIPVRHDVYGHNFTHQAMHESTVQCEVPCISCLFFTVVKCLHVSYLHCYTGLKEQYKKN